MHTVFVKMSAYRVLVLRQVEEAGPDSHCTGVWVQGEELQGVCISRCGEADCVLQTDRSPPFIPGNAKKAWRQNVQALSLSTKPRHVWKYAET